MLTGVDILVEGGGGGEDGEELKVSASMVGLGQGPHLRLVSGPSLLRGVIESAYLEVGAKAPGDRLGDNVAGKEKLRVENGRHGEDARRMKKTM